MCYLIYNSIKFGLKEIKEVALAKKSRKPRVVWKVYGRNDSGRVVLLGEANAVSERQACNYLRYRLYGETPYDQIPFTFLAEEKMPKMPIVRPVRRQAQMSMF